MRKYRYEKKIQVKKLKDENKLLTQVVQQLQDKNKILNEENKTMAEELCILRNLLGNITSVYPYQQ